MKIETCFESRGWLAASFVTTLLMFQWTMNQEWRFCPIQLFLVCFTECMSKVFLKFWVEQSELMDWNEKNGGTFPQPFSQESVWMVVFDRKQKPLKSSFSTSFFLYPPLSAWREKEICSLWNFVKLSFAPDSQLVGARENVYKGWWGGNIQIFSLWGGGKRYSLGDGTWNITTGAVSESETSCLTILVSVWEAWRDKEKQGLATRSVSYNQETLPSFFLPLLVVSKVNILAEAAGG